MSRLEELVRQFCPDGVEYKPLSAIATVTRGGNLQKKDFCESGIPCIHYGQIYTKFGLFTDHALTFVSNEVANRQKTAKPGDIVMAVTSENVEDVCKCVVWLGDEDAAVSGHTAIISSNQDAKFLAYFFHSSMFYTQKQKLAHGTKVIEVTPDRLKDIIVPVPPIEVQREIVRILDNFTELTAELAKELSSELTARKKQYEYYRDSLLTFTTEVEQIPLGELFDFRNGLSKGKEYFGRGIPFISYSNVYNHRALYKEDITALVECTPKEVENLRVSRGDVLFTRTSETAEDIGWSSVLLDDIGDCVFNGFSIKASPKTTKLLPEYCAYCFCTDSFRKYVSSHCAFTTRASLTGSTIADYKLAVPPLEVQKRIAYVLDHFDAICNDLNIGLPAEIEARQRQYAYYRDLLLSFNSSQIVNVERERERESAHGVRMR